MRSNNVNQVDLETQMVTICERMEEDIDTLNTVSTARANAEADYRYRHARAMVEQEAKMPVATKEAIAHLQAADYFREWQLLLAREKATQQALLAARSRLDALRTICANVRAAGG